MNESVMNNIEKFSAYSSPVVSHQNTNASSETGQNSVSMAASKPAPDSLHFQIGGLYGNYKDMTEHHIPFSRLSHSDRWQPHTTGCFKNEIITFPQLRSEDFNSYIEVVLNDYNIHPSIADNKMAIESLNYLNYKVADAQLTEALEKINSSLDNQEASINEEATEGQAATGVEEEQVEQLSNLDKFNGVLEQLGTKFNFTLSLNDQGICAFSYENNFYIIEFPIGSDSNKYYIYTDITRLGLNENPQQTITF